MAQKQVVVVGAGIIGASIAWHLTAAGARVTVVDAMEGGGVATPNSFAWIKPYCVDGGRRNEEVVASNSEQKADPAGKSRDVPMRAYSPSMKSRMALV